MTAQLDQGPTPQTVHPRRQGLPTALLILLLLSLLGTGICIASYFVPGAVVSGILVAVFYLMLVFVKRRRRHAPRPEHTVAGTNERLDEISPDIAEKVVAAERAGFRMGVIIMAPLVVLAVMLAAIFVGWRIIGLGALAFFAIMLFMGAPVWLAAMEEEIDDEGEKIGIEAHRIH